MTDSDKPTRKKAGKKAKAKTGKAQGDASPGKSAARASAKTATKTDKKSGKKAGKKTASKESSTGSRKTATTTGKAAIAKATASARGSVARAAPHAGAAIGDASEYRIRFAPFTSLSAGAFHDILKLRFDVFILEQQSLYPDIDGRDTGAVHGLAYIDPDKPPHGVLRILGLAPGATGPVTVARVAVAPDARGIGLGRRMLVEALKLIGARAPGRDVTLGAQLHLEDFYGTLGFRRTTDIYDDGGIPHVDMTRPARGA